MFDDLLGAVPSRPGWSAGLLGVMAISIALGAATLALAVAGVVLVIIGPWWVKILGVVVVGLAVELRPRLPRVPMTPGYKTRADEPALFAVIDSVASQVGSPSVDAVMLDSSFDASCARYGLRRRPVLVIGLPLWAALSPAGRIALLAHQLAHLVDGDPEQGLLTQPALSTFGNLARSFGPRAERRRPVETDDATVGALVGRDSGGNMLVFEEAGLALAAIVFKPLHWLFSTVQRRLSMLTARSRRRAEYYADALAVDVAGTAGVLEYCEVLLLSEPVFTSTRRWLRVGADVETVRHEAGDTMSRHSGDLRQHEQRSIRHDSSTLATHPPTGRRLRMLRSLPPADGRLQANTIDFAAVDSELQPDYRRVARSLEHVA